MANSEMRIGTLSEDTHDLIQEDFDSDILVQERARKRHMHVIGANGSGKSRFLRSLIQQDIRNGKGVAVLDPHGTLCDDVVKWLADRPLLAGERKVRVFDIGKGEDILSLNPLAVGDIKSETATVATRLADAVGRLFTKEELQEQPLTFEVMIMLFVSLAEHGMTLGDYHIFLDPSRKEEREHLIAGLHSTNTRRQWELLANYKDHEFVAYVSSVSRRLYTLLENPIINKTLTAKKNALDFRKAMDKGEILLFNLRDTTLFDPTSAQLLGLLLISSFFNAASVRKNTKPFFLYMDEAHRYMSSRTAEIFEQSRKFGLHLILAHQNLGQLREAGERIFGTVINEAAVKVIFQINEPDSADYLARLVFSSKVDPNKIKDVLTKPTVVGYTIETLISYSQAESNSYFDSESWATNQSENSGMTITELPTAHTLDEARKTEAVSSNTGIGSTHGSTYGTGTSNSSGYTETPTVLPVYENRPGGTWPIEEQMFVLANEITSLPIQHGIISIKAAKKKQAAGSETLKFRALDVADLHTPKFITKEYRQELRWQNPYILSSKKAQKLAEKRQVKLIEKINKERQQERVEREDGFEVWD